MRIAPQKFIRGRAPIHRFGLSALSVVLPLVMVQLTATAMPIRDARGAPLSLPEQHDATTKTAPAQDQLQAATPCVGGLAGIYPCDNVDLLAFMPVANIGGGILNDIWGWTDPSNGNEYAIVCRTSGTSFVDITDPLNPVYLGNLPSHTGSSTWRDAKVYSNHAFIVSDGNGTHGVQIFDLTQLRNVMAPPVTFSETAHYNGVGSSHNIAINEGTGYAYVVGSNTCAGGLHIINIQNPLVPTFAGCFSADGYTHDTQCVIYSGPDPDHQGQEICLNANDDTVTIVDVTNKAAPNQLSRTPYPKANYTHQGWLTENQRFFLFGDELDEVYEGINTTTHLLDVSDLDNPIYVGPLTGFTTAIDHNLYVRGNFLYEANYSAGFELYDISDIANANWTRRGFFDTYPADNAVSYNGAWSVYPYFPSGVIVVSSRNEGLFILDPRRVTAPQPPIDGVLLAMNDVLQSQGVDELVRIPNPQTGVGALIGSLGDHFIETEALAVRPPNVCKVGVNCSAEIALDEVYAVDNARLLRLDVNSGNGVVVGNIGFPDIDGISFHPQTRTLYGVTYGTNQIVSINTITGQGTLVASDVIVGRRLEDLAFQRNGDAYILTSGPRIYQVDINTGEKLKRWVLEGAESLEGLIWSPDGTTLFSAADRNGSKDLVTIELSTTDETGTITFVGPESSGFVDIEALAFLSVRTLNALVDTYGGAPVDTETQLPRKAMLHQNVPNPFNPSTRIRFDLARSGHVELSVYDVAGRHVATLLQGHHAAGAHTVEWDGRTDSGRLAAAGVYQYVLKTPQGSESQRMVLVK